MKLQWSSIISARNLSGERPEQREQTCPCWHVRCSPAFPKAQVSRYELWKEGKHRGPVLWSKIAGLSLSET